MQTWEVDALLLVDAEDLASGALLDHWHQRALLGDASVVVFAEMLRALHKTSNLHHILMISYQTFTIFS